MNCVGEMNFLSQQQKIFIRTIITINSAIVIHSYASADSSSKTDNLVSGNVITVSMCNERKLWMVKYQIVIQGRRKISSYKYFLSCIVKVIGSKIIARTIHISTVLHSFNVCSLTFCKYTHVHKIGVMLYNQ